MLIYCESGHITELLVHCKKLRILNPPFFGTPCSSELYSMETGLHDRVKFQVKLCSVGELPADYSIYCSRKHHKLQHFKRSIMAKEKKNSGFFLMDAISSLHCAVEGKNTELLRAVRENDISQIR